jgi:hypothetical protein
LNRLVARIEASSAFSILDLGCGTPAPYKANEIGTPYTDAQAAWWLTRNFILRPDTPEIREPAL